MVLIFGFGAGWGCGGIIFFSLPSFPPSFLLGSLQCCVEGAWIRAIRAPYILYPGRQALEVSYRR